MFGFFFSSRRRHTRWTGDWSSDVCSSDLGGAKTGPMTPRLIPYANGAMLVVVVGRPFTGTLTGGTPSAPPPKHQPPHPRRDPGATLLLMRAIRRKLPFRVEY